MNKDVIYIDIEDDITAVIGKVKAAGAKIVAIVPPKRIGALQSAVNLKLLQKAALQAQKRVVLITNDHSLMALAAGLRLPVAKNLQSRPEIPHITAPPTNEEEIINGQDLPVGDVAESLTPPNPESPKSAADEISDKVELGTTAVAGAAASTAASKPLPPKPKSLSTLAKDAKQKLKIPNFDTFRKRVFLFGGIGVLLIVLLVWAFVFAPRAVVTISAKTTQVNIDRTLTLNPNAQQSDPNTLLLKPQVQTLKKAVAAEFDATGTKDIGNKAGGTVMVRNCDYADDGELTISLGTKFTSSSGKVFVSTASVQVPGFNGPSSSCSLSDASEAGTVSVPVQAADIGPDYNVPAQAFTFNESSSVIDAQGGAMTGGTKETVTVVTQQDVDKAKATLTQSGESEVKQELKEQFTDDVIIIEESFTADQPNPVVAPAVGEPAKRAKVTIETNYSYTALLRTEAKAVLTNALNEALKDKTDQQIYDYGDNDIAFQSFQKLENGTFTSRLVTSGAIGPKIDTKALAQQISGKRYGEIEAIANQISGIDKVDISFSPFWVTSAPGADKIEIKFSVAHDE